MNWIDIVVIAVLLAAAIWGIWKGFIAQLVSILGVFVGIWGASKLTPIASDWITGLLGAQDSENAVKIITFAVLFILIIIICHYIGKLLEKAFSLTIIGGLNKFLGAVFCVLKTAVILIAAASLIHSGIEAANIDVPEVLKDCKSYQLLNTAADNLLPYVKKIFNPSSE